MTGGLTKPAAEARAHKVTQGVPACDAGIAADADVCKHRKCKTHPRAMQESPQMQMFANIGSVRRTRVQGTKGSAHVLPAWRRARSEPDLRKAAREAVRRAQDCAKRRRRKCARAVMRCIMWNIKIYHSPGERAFLLQKTILCMKITQK